MEKLEVRCKAPSTDVAEVTALLLNENKNNFYSILTSSRKNEIHSLIIYCIFQSSIFREILCFQKWTPKHNQAIYSLRVERYIWQYGKTMIIITQDTILISCDKLETCPAGIGSSTTRDPSVDEVVSENGWMDYPHKIRTNTQSVALNFLSIFICH